MDDGNISYIPDVPRRQTPTHPATHHSTIFGSPQIKPGLLFFMDRP